MNAVPVLTCTDLSIGYRNQKHVVKEVSKHLNLTLRTGEMVCLVGPNGSGKSTLIRTLTGIQPPLGGEIRLRDKRISDISPEERARSFSVVLTTPVQAGYLTAFDIVALGRFPYTNWAGKLTGQDTQIVLSALSSAGAGDLAMRFIHELSDGERQKVMIARALAQEPELMVLDEPTAFLDLPHKIETMRILRKVARQAGKSILLSTHDLNIAIRCADQLWIMDRNGAMISGSPEDLILSGIFGSAFEIDGVVFDPVRGEFTLPADQQGTFSLDALESVERIWTLCALERIGYVPSNGVAADITITIGSDQGKPFWLVRHNGAEQRCGNIRELVDSLALRKKGDSS
ncbi:MAG: ABC transporter ATP-binding protein [Methanomicrobiales archaeon]|nr:ABC transporter ATP-binding protein [Methanomicrobiales archaeon]